MQPKIENGARDEEPEGPKGEESQGLEGFGVEVGFGCSGDGSLGVDAWGRAEIRPLGQGRDGFRVEAVEWWGEWGGGSGKLLGIGYEEWGWRRREPQP